MRAMLAAMLLLPLLSTRAAQVVVEDFNSGGNGWAFSSTSSNYRFTNGVARMRFAGGVPVPGSVVLIASNTASGGAFVGDYPASNLLFMGFSIIVTAAPPNQLLLQVQSGTNSILSTVGGRISRTGEWTKIVCSMASAELGSWTESSPGIFPTVLASVDHIRAQFLQNAQSTLTEVYLVDDFFLASSSPLQLITPASHDFGQLVTGDTAQVSILVTNAGSLSMTGLAEVASGPFSMVGATTYALAPGATTNIVVQFAPDSPGLYAETVALKSDGGAMAFPVTGLGLDAAELEVDPASFDFGVLVTGATAYATFTATNSGGATLTGTAAVAGAPFAVTEGASFVLPAGAYTSVVVAFSPMAAQAYTSAVVFASTGGGVTGAVAGTGFDGPLLGVAPAGIDYGTVVSGIASDAVFVVTNRGSQLLTGTAAAGGPPFSVEAGGAYSLAPGATTTTVVRFEPLFAGGYTGQVVFAGNAGSLTGVLVGTAVNAPLLAFGPAEHAFGGVVTGTSAQASIGVTNIGSAILTGHAQVTDPAYALIGDTNLSLLPGESATLTVLFLPPALGAYSNDLEILSDGGNALVPLTGSGEAATVPATLAVSPASFDFGTIPVLTASQAVFVVTNSGTVALTGTAAVAGSPYAVTQGTSFAVPGNGWTNVVVVFSPTQAGVFGDSLVFLSNGGGATNPLTGAGYLPTGGSTNYYAAQSGGVFQITFLVSSGAWYHVEATTNLLDPSGWFSVSPTSRAAGVLATYGETSPPPVMRAYRIRSP